MNTLIHQQMAADTHMHLIIQTTDRGQKK